MAKTIRGMARVAAASVTFLTVLPIGRLIRIDGDDVARGAVLFPFVGAGIGAAAGTVAWQLGLYVSPPLAGAAAVTVSAVITGALHLDGLADFADQYGGHTVTDRLRIMRDHAVGTFGTVALILSLLIKTEAYAFLAGMPHVVACSIAAAGLSRAAGPSLALALPYAHSTRGAGHALSASSRPGRVALTWVFATVVAALVIGRDVAVAVPAAFVVIALVGAAAKRRLNGVSGDVMGAAIELTETLVLTVLVSFG